MNILEVYKQEDLMNSMARITFNIAKWYEWVEYDADEDIVDEKMST